MISNMFRIYKIYQKIQFLKRYNSISKLGVVSRLNFILNDQSPRRKNKGYCRNIIALHDLLILDGVA